MNEDNKARLDAFLQARKEGEAAAAAKEAERMAKATSNRELFMMLNEQVILPALIDLAKTLSNNDFGASAAARTGGTGAEIIARKIPGKGMAHARLSFWFDPERGHVSMSTDARDAPSDYGRPIALADIKTDRIQQEALAWVQQYGVAKR